MDKLGKRIKERREAIHQSLNTLGKNANVSTSLLSQIEHGKAFPSLHTLKRIADSLNTTVGMLIGEHESISTNPVIKFDERKLVKRTDSGASLFLLSHYSPTQSMETYLARLEKKGNAHTITEYSRHGQAFCHVLNGMIEVHLSERFYILKHGDSIYFDTNELHGITNLFEGVSDFLWIVSPDKF